MLTSRVREIGKGFYLSVLERLGGLNSHRQGTHHKSIHSGFGLLDRGFGGVERLKSRPQTLGRIQWCLFWIQHGDGVVARLLLGFPVFELGREGFGAFGARGLRGGSDWNGLKVWNRRFFSPKVWNQCNMGKDFSWKRFDRGLGIITTILPSQKRTKRNEGIGKSPSFRERSFLV